jgi:formyl-CoA transferase
VGNDRQWKSLVSQERFQSLDLPEYEKNAGRIQDVINLNKALSGITRQYTSEELIALFNEITVPISKIKSVAEVINDPLVNKRLLHTTDPKTGTRVTLAPPPNIGEFLEASGNELCFPPRFGEHNHDIYGGKLGLSDEQIAELQEKGVL